MCVSECACECEPNQVLILQKYWKTGKWNAEINHMQAAKRARFVSVLKRDEFKANFSHGPLTDNGKWQMA